LRDGAGTRLSIGRAGAGRRSHGERARMTSSTQRLPMRTKLAFGVGAAAEAGASIAFNTFNFLFYNQVMGLSGTLCGLAVTIALALDALADPIVGSLSDRHKSKLGRRHPFMFLSPLPMGLFFFLIYVPPKGMGELGLFAWFTAFTLLYRQAQTLYHVPHLALGAELTSDYRERSVIMAWNALFGVFGGSAAFFFGWTWFSSIEGGSKVRDGYPLFGAGIGLAVAVIIFVSAWFTRDRIPHLRQAPEHVPPFSLRELLAEILGCLKNDNYRNLLLGLICISATIGTRETLNSHVALFFWELPESKIRVFGLASPPAFLVAFFIVARLHARFDKRSSIVSAVALVAFAAATPPLLRFAGLMPENGSPRLISILFLFVFLYYGGIAMLVISVLSALADITDEHDLNTGKRQEGVFFAARTFFSQVTTGLGHVAAGVAMDVIGFPSGAKVGAVDPDVVFRLGLVDGPLTAIPALAAMYFYGRYAISKERLTDIQSQLRAR
jgi:glycoside/pentoside/hexuronide:cation symporter, GPH family